jgi:hypothetical protein
MEAIAVAEGALKVSVVLAVLPTSTLPKLTGPVGESDCATRGVPKASTKAREQSIRNLEETWGIQKNLKKLQETQKLLVRLLAYISGAGARTIFWVDFTCANKGQNNPLVTPALYQNDICGAEWARPF